MFTWCELYDEKDYRMGGTTSMVELRDAVNTLSNDVDIPPDHPSFWRPLFAAPPHADALAALLPPAVLRYWRCYRPAHLALLAAKCLEQLTAFAEGKGGEAAGDTNAVEAALALLARVIPAALEFPTEDVPETLVEEARTIARPAARDAAMYRVVSPFSKGFAQHALYHNKRCLDSDPEKTFDLEEPMLLLLARYTMRCAAVPGFSLGALQSSTLSGPSTPGDAPADQLVDRGLLWSGSLFAVGNDKKYVSDQRTVQNRFLWLEAMLSILSAPLYCRSENLLHSPAREVAIDLRHCPGCATVLASILTAVTDYCDSGYSPTLRVASPSAEGVAVASAQLLIAMMDSSDEQLEVKPPVEDNAEQRNTNTSTTAEPADECVVAPTDVTNLTANEGDVADASPVPRPPRNQNDSVDDASNGSVSTESSEKDVEGSCESLMKKNPHNMVLQLLLTMPNRMAREILRTVAKFFAVAANHCRQGLAVVETLDVIVMWWGRLLLASPRLLHALVSSGPMCGALMVPMVDVLFHASHTNHHAMTRQSMVVLVQLSTHRAFAVGGNGALAPKFIPPWFYLGMGGTTKVGPSTVTRNDVLLKFILHTMRRPEPHLADYREMLAMIVANMSPYITAMHSGVGVELGQTLEHLAQPSECEKRRGTSVVGLLTEAVATMIQYQYVAIAPTLPVIFGRIAEGPSAFASVRRAVLDGRFDTDQVATMQFAVWSHAHKAMQDLFRARMEELHAVGISMREAVGCVVGTTFVGLLPVPHRLLLRTIVIGPTDQRVSTMATWQVAFLTNRGFHLNDPRSVEVFKPSR